MGNKPGVNERNKAIKSYFSRLLLMRTELSPSCRLLNLAGLLLATSGAVTLAWVGQLTWNDVTAWNKDLTLIFFGSRTGEAISLGMDMRVIHYLFIGLALLLPGSLLVLRGKTKTVKFRLDNSLFSLKENEEKKKTEATSANSMEKKEKVLQVCPHNFGYLALRLKGTPIPQECLTCSEILQCIQTEIADGMD